MLAAAKTRPGPGIDLIDFAEPVAGSSEVLLKVAYCGICGSDLAVYHWSGAPSVWNSNLPRIMGHEFAGHTVSDVNRIAAGTLVAVEPGAGCGHCPQCRDGFTNLCREKTVLGHDINGALAPYVSVPVESLRPVPSTMDAKRAAFLEVFAIGVHALERARLRPGDRVLVVGAGPVALSIVALCPRPGAPRPVLVGTSDDREIKFPVARALGAEAAETENLPEDARFDVVFEASGAPAGVAAAVKHCVEGGRIIALGIPPVRVAVPWIDVVRKAIRITPVFARLRRHWTIGGSILSNLELPDSFFAEFELPQIDAAFRTASDRRACKVLIRPE